jgi:hypothetical protein
VDQGIGGDQTREASADDDCRVLSHGHTVP